MSFPSRRFAGPACALVLVVLAASCAGVFQQSFEAFGRHPEPARWWFAFPEEIHVLDRSTRPDAAADTLVFFILPPLDDLSAWPDVADVAGAAPGAAPGAADADPGAADADPDAGEFRIRYLMLSPEHDFLGEQVVVMEGENRPRVAFGVPRDLNEIELRATLERELPAGEIVSGRILRGSFRRAKSD